MVEGVERYSQIYETFLFGWEILLPHQSLIHTTRSLRHCFPLDAVDLNICLDGKQCTFLVNLQLVRVNL